MFRISIRSLETETYEPLQCEPYQTREEAEEARKHMLVQVRQDGEFIAPEEFEIVEE
jgi:hypothetical protein